MTTSKPQLRTGVRMSLDEFLALGETDGRWELDDGVLYIMSSGSADHQFLMFWIRYYLEVYLNGFEIPPAQAHHELTTILSRELQRAPEPDLVIISGRTDISVAVHIEGAPDIVVEILSSDRSRDLVYKRQIYAEAGVLEYWVLDPRNDTVLPLELHGREYVERPILSAADTLGTPLLPGLAIPLADIFHHRRRPPREE